MMPKPLLYCLLFLGLLGCKTESNHIQSDLTVTVQIESEPPSLHPTNARTTYRDLILGLVHQRLHIIDITEPGNIVPELAEGMPVPSTDGNSYIIRIHPKASWPDSTAITADDVLFTFKAIACPLTNNAAQKGYLEFLRDVRPVEGDPKSVELVFGEFYMNNQNISILSFVLDHRKFDPDQILSNYSVSDFLGDMADSLAQQEDIQQWATFFNDGKLGRDPEWLNAGSGPYQVTSWEPEKQIVLTRRENYWGKDLPGYVHRATPKELVFEIIREDATLELQLKEQNIDVATLSIQSARTLSESELVNSNYDLVRPAKASIAMIVWNLRPESGNRNAVFDDVRVRQAVAYALPIDSILSQNFALPQQRAVSPVAPSNPDHNDHLVPTPHDPVKARDLLAEAGWTDSDEDGWVDKMINGVKMDLEFEILYAPNSQAVIDVMDRFESELAQVGIRLIQKQSSLQEYLPQVINHQFDAALFAMSSSDLPYDFKQVYHSSSWGGGSNLMGYQDSLVDVWIDQARIEQDPAIRKDLVDRIQVRLYEDQPALFLFHPRSEMAVHKKLNADIHPVSPHLLLNTLGSEE